LKSLGEKKKKREQPEVLKEKGVSTFKKPSAKSEAEKAEKDGEKPPEMQAVFNRMVTNLAPVPDAGPKRVMQTQKKEAR
jgi:hypothetical protein